MPALNYHHLYYFWVIANERSLSTAAERLHISQSALSIQLRRLEECLGQKLFRREHRRLTLTEAGRIALVHANTIFRTGEDLLGLMRGAPSASRHTLHLGAVATLSRNFLLELLKPLEGRPEQLLVIRSGSLRELLLQLKTMSLDLVLSNRPVQRDSENQWHSHLLNEQQVSLVGKPRRRPRRFRFPEDLRGVPLLLPSLESDIRAAFDLLAEHLGFTPFIIAEVDDMAMLRVMAREFDGLTLVPPVVVKQELETRKLVEHYCFPDIQERFYAITLTRRFPNPLVQELVSHIRQAP